MEIVETIKKCKKCGGTMKRIDENTIECERCGDTLYMTEEKGMNKDGENYIDSILP